MNESPLRIRHAERLNKAHPFRQWKTWTLPGTQLTVTGYSRSNDKTFFHLPELRCCIDAGLYEGKSVDTAFLTHTHHDHSYDIEFIATEQDGRVIYAPVESLEYLERYLRTKGELNFHAPYDPTLARNYSLRGVRGGDTFAFGKSDRYRVKAVQCVHKVPCVGYCFSERKTRFLPEFEALRASLFAANRHKEFGQRIAALKTQGVVTHEDFDAPLVAFMGDSHVKVFEENPWLFEYPVIVTECTFLDDRERERAERAGHALWSQLRPIVDAHPQNTFVLTHFSLRHSDREVVEFFQTPENHRENVVVWAHPESVMPEQHQKAT